MHDNLITDELNYTLVELLAEAIFAEDDDDALASVISFLNTVRACRVAVSEGE